MRAAWNRLRLPNKNDSIPPLLIKYAVGVSTYSIWITDLTLIWMESLDRKQIIQRSFSVDTSIDPSEGSDQLRLFLQSVQSALEQRPGTALNLVKSDEDQRLLLRTSTPLPGSLRPLDWFVDLMLAPQSNFTSEFIVPLLSQHVNARIEKASLLQLLKEKDHVITKMADKMHSDGTDLGRIFPGIAASKSGKQTSLQTLGKSLKGLGEFDEQQCRERLTKTASSSTGYIGLVSSAFEDAMLDLSENAHIPKFKDWWERLGNQKTHHQETLQDPDSVENEGGELDSVNQSSFQVWSRLKLYYIIIHY